MKAFKGIVVAVFGLVAASLPVRAAEGEDDPTWWFGLAGAANLNIYEGTTQRLNDGFVTPEPFHKGFGIGPYLALALEYRHDAHWGGMLQLGYDDRRGEFDPILCRPCDETATLKAAPAYLSLEPSLRLAPFGGGLHVFAGPRLGYLTSPIADEKSFRYKRENEAGVKGPFSAMRGWTYSGQIGLGYAFESNGSSTRTRITPFVAYQPHFGQDPRQTDHDVEWWALSTLRAGVSVLFGKAKPPAGEPDFRVAVRAPARVVLARRIQETFPLRNYVYFDEGSENFAARYARLTAAEAATFREEDLQLRYPARPTGRTVRQMAVYRNILNVMGDRLRRNPGATITLRGLFPPQASGRGESVGLARAMAVRRYLVATFGLDPARIAVEAVEEPRLPLGRPLEDLEMLRAESRRVEIHTRSPELLVQVGEGFMLRPVEISGDEGVDSVVFHAADANRHGDDSLAAWTVDVTDDLGVRRRFGPFHDDARGRAAVPASVLLGDRAAGRYAAVVTGSFVKRGEAGSRAPGAKPVAARRDLAFDLARKGSGVEETSRFSILFDIDEARAVSAYDLFLARMVAPRIASGATVFIRGRTDVVTDAAYNLRLSKGRAEGVLRNLERAVAREGVRNVSFRPSWTGEDPAQAPYGNVLPEERNYNRTVIIDILPD